MMRLHCREATDKHYYNVSYDSQVNLASKIIANVSQN